MRRVGSISARMAGPLKRAWVLLAIAVALGACIFLVVSCDGGFGPLGSSGSGADASTDATTGDGGTESGRECDVACDPSRAICNPTTGMCEPCGNADEACCPPEPPSVYYTGCNGAYACNSSNRCVPCGGAGQPCCHYNYYVMPPAGPTQGSPCGSGLGCDFGTDTCGTCGYLGQACCAGNACYSPGTTCQDGGCLCARAGANGGCL
jgi:hypothetical protein